MSHSPFHTTTLGLLTSFLLLGCTSITPVSGLSPSPTPELEIASLLPPDDPYAMTPKERYRLAPSAPASVSAVAGKPGSGTITVTWSASSWIGRGDFIGYLVTEMSTLQVISLAADDATSVMFGQLSPGIYTFTVTALGHYANVTSEPTEPVRLRADRHIATLANTLSADVRAYGADAGVSVIELYPDGESWSLNGQNLYIAASTYKLGILMYEAQAITSGKLDPNGSICYDPAEYEPGLGDVVWDGCYTRNFLAYRVAHYSNNTAAHMLITDLGSGPGLNAYIRAHGATNPQLYYPNYVSSDDLAALWRNEYEGKAGGNAAKAWLYPLLTNTDPSHEQGIPAGTPDTATVVHKIGNYASGNNDAALVLYGPSGDYILVVLTDGLSASTANALMRRLAADTWAYEDS